MPAAWTSLTSGSDTLPSGPHRHRAAQIRAVLPHRDVEHVFRSDQVFLRHVDAARRCGRPGATRGAGAGAVARGCRGAVARSRRGAAAASAAGVAAAAVARRAGRRGHVRLDGVGCDVLRVRERAMHTPREEEQEDGPSFETPFARAAGSSGALIERLYRGATVTLTPKTCRHTSASVKTLRRMLPCW